MIAREGIFLTSPYFSFQSFFAVSKMIEGFDPINRLTPIHYSTGQVFPTSTGAAPNSTARSKKPNSSICQ
jgi:hypothetical protein